MVIPPPHSRKDPAGWREIRATIRRMTRRTPPALLLLLLALAAPAFADTIEIKAANGSYSELGAQIQPIQQGPFTIEVASPRHRITVFANRLDLQWGAGSVVNGRFEVELEGFGDLIADVIGPGESRNHFEETVTARRQRVRVAAALRFAKVKEGYLVTLVEPLSRSIDIVVESKLSENLLSMCKVFEVLPMLNLLDCGSLEKALTQLAVPMPAVGTQWLLSNERLTASEKRFFDRFSGAPPARTP